MSSRERWTVYPLLFLTMGIALPDKLTRQIDVDRVVCKSLEVTDRQANVQVAVCATSGGGLVQTFGNQAPNVFLGHTDRFVGMLFLDANGNLATDGRGRLLPNAVVPTASLGIRRPWLLPEAATAEEPTGEKPPIEATPDTPEDSSGRQ